MLSFFILAALAEEPPTDSVRRTPVVRAVEHATPSVVALEVDIPRQSPFELFGGGPSMAASQGSGVIIGADGIVLTNAHVVRGAAQIRAHTLDGRSFTAEPIALDVELDLAVLRLEDADDLIAIEVANSNDLMLGETVIAIGNPMGLGLTVSTGVVASVARLVEIQSGVYQTYIQTDAAINPGNSGGALVDLHGRLIGINTAIRAGAQGIGFAIPANRAQKIADDLLLYGSIRAPWLGCDFDDINPNRLVGTGLTRGALRVTSVHSGSPCEVAEIHAGDLVFQIDGHQTGTRSDLNAWLAGKKPGDTVVLEAVHAQKVVARKLKTIELPHNVGELSLKKLGVRLHEVTTGGLAAIEIEPKGSWALAGLRRGDVLLAVDGKPAPTLEELTAILRAAKARHQPSGLFTVRRGMVRGHVAIEL